MRPSLIDQLRDRGRRFAQWRRGIKHRFGWLAPLHVALDDEALLPQWPELLDFHRALDHSSLYVLPLAFGQSNVGVVVLGFTDHAPLRGELAELLVALGQQVTLALAMKRLMHASHKAAVLAERNRMGREIHALTMQVLTPQEASSGG